MATFGIHTGLDNTNVNDLRAVWRSAEDLGFHWISIWDHFYSPTGSGSGLDSVAVHAALAMETSRVRCGCLVYSPSFRHVAVLAKAICTVDHLSGGRAEIGLGAGWNRREHEAYGFDFVTTSKRFDRLDEAVYCLRSLLQNDVTTFSGDYFTLREARCDPGPVQARLPLWIGGGGERRTLRTTAQHADGWNIPYVSPARFAHKRNVLWRWCDELGRDPSTIRCSVNVAVASSEAEFLRRYGRQAAFAQETGLIGKPNEIADRVWEYVDIGADQVNLILRAPWERDLLEEVAVALDLTNAPTMTPVGQARG
jgi:alkanesulfonate monooxygenase SsuD/methylene tetrahydromethanopterin reductase-like flavin-dependent oxidoreductase (luciferase family)